MSVTQSLTLRDKQSKALELLLNFNGSDNSTGPIWKVLVFDSVGRDIISSVLRVNDLFRNGVTLYMLAASERHALSDVPAIYFVEPTEENIAQIGKDVVRGLYQSWSINFTSPLSRSQLEDLASKTLHSSAKINQVYDQYLQFCMLESDIFSLELPNVYRDFANPRATDDDINSLVAKIVNDLFCVVMTYNAVPIIRASRGNAAESIAQMLDEKIRSYLGNPRSAALRDSTASRPVLLIVDRNIDLVSMFTHSWTYQSLINDACEFQRNRITIKGEDGKRTAYDLDPTDFFWGENKTLPFPDVANNIDAALNKYKADTQRLTGGADISEIEPSAAHLKSAMDELPELTQRKQVIDMHMNISTVLLKAITDRGLAQLFDAEETAAGSSKQEILELIQNKEFLNAEDKLRLYMVYFIVSNNLSPADQQELEAALTEQGCDLAALAHVKRSKELSKMSLLAGSANTAESHQGDLLKRVGGMTSKLTEKLNQGSLSGSFGGIISGIKNFLPANKDLPLTKIVQSILDSTASSSVSSVTDDYLCFDPKESRGSRSRPPKRGSHDEAIVFTVGGGNYYEYANVQNWAAKVGTKKITYGSTSLVAPTKFVQECAELGRMV
ncbi:Protein sly1 [Wickerhamiella sorbophila]|uniref:Protein sly1 n=1 Tax=Wickerhamiella sorbophila TaxID=45607 RepID=A0A2T0FDN4_9ASCO|nr:Protein sly1 [Wickerhamiella sorbophila]PRT53116.1 Protein sly1 [Wickerhamiella sorbophila]